MIGIKWTGSSVSGLVVIAGIIALILNQFGTGLFLIVLGLFGAILMTKIINTCRVLL